MSQTTMLVGPRGWAALTLAGGSILAMPFLRSAPTQASGQSDSDMAIERSSDPSGANIVSFHESASESIMPGRRVSGILPATSQLAPASDAFDIPAWAKSGSKLDELITSEAASLPAPTIGSRSQVESLRPWTTAADALGANPPPNQVGRDEQAITPRRDSQFSMRPVLPPAIVQPPSAPAVGTASGSASIIRTTAVTSQPDYNARQSLAVPQGRKPGHLPSPASVFPTENSLANPPRRRAFVYQPGLPRE